MLARQHKDDILRAWELVQVELDSLQPNGVSSRSHHQCSEVDIPLPACLAQGFQPFDGSEPCSLVKGQQEGPRVGRVGQAEVRQLS